MPVKNELGTLVDDPAARALIREAHGRTYKWPSSFGGYRADVTLNDEGRILKGTVRSIPRVDTTIGLAGADPAIQDGCASGCGRRGCTWPIRRSEKAMGSTLLSFDPEEDSAVAPSAWASGVVDRRAARVVVLDQALPVHPVGRTPR